jgi:predicted Zn finger-like uncharacterized protein
MILTCPSCGTQYVVKDGAIPPEGRQVRCAACKHSWHQEPEPETAETGGDEGPPVDPGKMEMGAPSASEGELANAGEAELPASEEDVASAGVADEDGTLAEASLIDPRSGPEAEERAYEEAVIEGAADPEMDSAAEPAVGVDEPAEAAAEDWRGPPDPEAAPDMFSPFAGEDEMEPRRGSALTKVLIVALVVVAVAVAFWFLAPADVKARLGIASASASPLQVSNPPHVERLQLASGNELLTVSGRVINPTGREQEVPPLNARLTNQQGKLVYSWTIAPPTRSLAAGASASFNSAEVNVPPGGEYLTITLGQKA